VLRLNGFDAVDDEFEDGRVESLGTTVCVRGGNYFGVTLEFSLVKIIAADKTDTRCHYLASHGPKLVAACGPNGTLPIILY
jgi:hypothetical protein